MKTAISSRPMLYVVSDTEREFEINGNIKTKFVFFMQKNVLLYRKFCEVDSVGWNFQLGKSPNYQNSASSVYNIQ